MRNERCIIIDKGTNFHSIAISHLVYVKADGNYTDDCSMLEELNIPVYIVNGSYTNIKITVKSDLDFAKLYI